MARASCSKSTGAGSNRWIIASTHLRRAIRQPPEILRQAHDKEDRIHGDCVSWSWPCRLLCWPDACPHTTAGSARTQAAGTSLQPAQQLQSTTRLRADLDAVKAAATEGDLLVAVAQAQRDCQAVTGTHANSNDALWQRVLTNLQQALSDVSQLADAHSSTPDATNPLRLRASSGHSKRGPKFRSPSKPPSSSSSPIISELQNADKLLRRVGQGLGYVISVNNGRQPGGTVTILNTGDGPYPDIHCGIAEATCSGVVLALNTVGISFQPKSGVSVYTIGKIDSTPDGACNALYQAKPQPPGTQASCDVTATSGQNITITPHWVPS